MYETLIPRSIRTLLDVAADNITRKCDIELWDEATSYLIEQLRLNAASKFGMEIVGAKYAADVREHLEEQDRNSRYIITKRGVE